MAKDKGTRWGIVVGCILAALMLGTCVAVCGDDEDESSLGKAGTAAELAYTLPDAVKCAPFHCDPKPQSKKDRERSREGYDRSDGRESRGDCEGANYCDERDASPTFNDSPIIVCVQPGACDFGSSEDQEQQT